MKTLVPKIIVVCLLLLMATPMLVPVWYKLQQWDIKKQMVGLLKERQLQTLRLAAKDVVWMDKHEIWVNEQMFDVASSVLIDGTYTFTGLYDAEETKFVNKQMKAGAEDSKQQQRTIQIVKWLNFQYIVNEPITGYTRLASKISYPLVSIKISTVFKKLTTPPPRALAYHIY